MRFREMPDYVQEEKIKLFINKLVKSLRVKDIDINELKFIYDETYKIFFNSNYFDSELSNIYNEIVRNYKFYIPFCFASIRTALRKINE